MKQNDFKFFWKIFQTGLNRCLQYVYIVIATQLLEGHGILCIMISLDIYDIDIIQLDQLLSSEIITINFVRSKDNIVDPITKGLTRGAT